MRKVIGIAMIVAGIAFGLYVGVWICFTGGIIHIINDIKSPDALTVMDFALNISKIIFAGLLGLLAGICLIFPGYVVLKKQI